MPEQAPAPFMLGAGCLRGNAQPKIVYNLVGSLNKRSRHTSSSGEPRLRVLHMSIACSITRRPVRHANWISQRRDNVMSQKTTSKELRRLAVLGECLKISSQPSGSLTFSSSKCTLLVRRMLVEDTGTLAHKANLT